MRSLILAAVGAAALCFLAGGTARAETADPKPIVTPDVKPVCVCGDDCKCDPGVCPGKCPLLLAVADAPGGHWEQQCTTDSRGRKFCVRVWIPDPATAPVVEAAAEPHPRPRQDVAPLIGDSDRRRPVIGAIGFVVNAARVMWWAVHPGIIRDRLTNLRDRQPIFPNRPRLRGGFFRGTCSSCGG